MPKTIVRAEKSRRSRSAVLVEATNIPWQAVGVVGALIALAGWTDVALLWYPSRFGSQEWEFGMASTTFDSLALGTLGLAAFAFAVLARARRPWVPRLLALLFVGVGVVLLGVYALYMLNLPVALQAMQEPMKPVLKAAAVKTSVFAFCYFTLYVVVGVLCFRRSGETALRGESGQTRNDGKTLEKSPSANRRES